MKAGPLAASLAALLAGVPPAGWSAEEPPPGIQQLLPRGAIPAIVEPRFVSADEAALPDDAWVLAGVVEGEARAYSLNLLNRHEVVNDRAGSTAFAAVW